MIWEDYVYDKNKKTVRVEKTDDQNNSRIIYLGRFLSWEEVNASFDECNYEMEEVIVMYKNVTSYSRGDKEHKPSILQNEVNGIVFKVHKHIYYGNQWLLSCAELNIDKFDLDTDDMEAAKRKGIVKMKELLEARIAKYQKAIEMLDQ